MSEQKQISISKYIAQALFLLLPTILVVLFILWNSNQYFSILKAQWAVQTIYFSIGFVMSFFVYQTRLRFLPSAALLALLLSIIYKSLDYFAVGEFDSFFISVQFMVFASLFFVGWVAGWGLQRVHVFPIFLAGVLLVLCIYLISKTGEITMIKLIQYFAPIVIYSIYQVYTSQAFRLEEHFNRRFWWKFGKRLVLFGSLMFLLFGSVVLVMYDEIKAKVEEYGGQGKEGENQLLKNNKDGTVENKKSMGMGISNQRNKNPEPLFCAHIDNYFPNSDIPNPLYLTSYHFTKFDTFTETFERDSTILFGDEFQPNPSRIPLFSTYKDSSRLLKALGTKNRKTVSIEVYKKRLTAGAFIAPSTSFWVQPITVEKDFQKEFNSAYRAKSYVSELNSAYFIYNSDNPQIVQFQQQRFETLRKAKGYETIDKTFFDYHTFFPTSIQYLRIQSLADSLAMGKKTAIDKVLAVRDYFTARDELGEQTFTYSDNPGVPGLPGSSKLINFLFETKKGYCAYYAGATVFILRAMKIPCRVVTGFLTVDRSDKNTGWYWFYEDQSHGWVQVYFPEYGWIDFDTTVGNDEAEQSPAPDGTPPMQPPNPVLAIAGKVVSIDTLKKSIGLQASNLLFKDQEFSAISELVTLDLVQANIWKDSLKVTMQRLRKGDDVMAVSYAEKLNSVSLERNIKALVSKFKPSIPIDELFIKDLSKVNNDKKTNETNTKQHGLKYYLAIIAIVLVLLLLIIFSLPRIIYAYFKYSIGRTKKPEEQSYRIYRAAIYLLNQHGVARNNSTAWHFAKHIVDPRFNTNFGSFMQLYLKQKYAKQAISSTEMILQSTFFPVFHKQVSQSFSLKQRFFHFMNLNRFINYFYILETELQNP